MNNKRYTLSQDENEKMVNESAAVQYDNIETLKLLCMEKIIKLNDSKILKTIIHAINEMTYKSSKDELQPYTIEELLSRTDEAYEELETGGGIDGELYFDELNKYVLSR